MVRNVSTLHEEHEDHGTDPEIALLKKEVKTLHQKFEQTEKDKYAMITMFTTWVSGIEGRLANLDGGIHESAEISASGTQAIENFKFEMSQANTRANDMHKTLDTIVTDVRKVEVDVGTLQDTSTTIIEDLVNVDDRVEYVITEGQKLGNFVKDMNKGLVDGFRKVEEAIETIESKINRAPAKRKVRRVILSQPIPPVPSGPPITTATEWRQRCLAEVRCKKFGDRCEMMCRVCHHDYRGKAVTVNAHVNHLKTKHNFVARRDIDTTNGGAQFLPHFVDVGPEVKKRDEQCIRQVTTLKRNLERDVRAEMRRY